MAAEVAEAARGRATCGCRGHAGSHQALPCTARAPVSARTSATFDLAKAACDALSVERDSSESLWSLQRPGPEELLLTLARLATSLYLALPIGIVFA